MFIDIDYNKKMKDYKIELSKPNKTIITNLSERIDAMLSVGLGSIGELTFKIPYKIENDYHEIIDNPNIDLLREKMYLRLTIGNQKMWFIVDNISDQTEDLDMMNVQAFSLPIELKNKKISELNLTSVNADMLMDELLVSSSWSKGTVDLELKSTYRTFDFSETTIYDALVSSAETFGAIIVWDEENKTISFRELTNISQYKGMSVNAEKFLNSLKRTRDTDEMVTRLYVYGNEKMSIQNVNPSGLRYIEDFSYFLEPFTRDANKNVLTHSNYMSDELCHAILDNKELKELALPQINTLQSEVIVLNSNLALKDIELTELKLSLSTTKGLLDIAKSTGDTALIAQRQSEVINFETLVSTKTSEIGTIISQINTKTNEMTALQDSVSITSFTPELLDELDVYIVEKDFYDDRYIDETELYNAGINKFAEIRSPKIVVEISIDNLLNVVEEQYYWDKIVLGDMIQVKYPNMKINYKSTIVGLDFDLDEMDCSVKIANHTDNLDSIDKLVSIIYENQTTALTVSNNKYKWDSIIDVRDRVDQLRDGEIDAVKNRIKAGVNESVNIGDNGIVLTNPNFPEEMVIMQAGVIALTRDGGETWNTSITPRGVIAETIIGNLIAGNELVITNSSGTFVMDASGLTIDADNIFINSGDTQTPENLVEYWNSMSLTMAEFSNDNVINKYEKQQIKKQWDNIVSVHNSMIDKFYAEIGTETTENPYPVEYDIYMEKYEALNTYLNTTLQSDGFSILNALNADNTTTINPLVYNTKFSEFSKAKDDFQIVIPMEYTKASISVLESGINLNYVKNNNVVAMINLSEEGVRIDGKLLTIDAETHFNNDLVMNAGVIKSADGGTVLDLNNNTFTFDKPFTIGVSNVATVEDVENIEMTYIASLSSDVSVISTDVDGNNGDFTDVDTSIHIFQRDIDVTAVGWTFSAVASTGVTGTLTGNNYDVSGMSVDNGYVDITAKKDLINLTKRFSISKSRAGNTGANGGDGENAQLVFLNSTSQIFSKNANGTISPSTIKVDGTTQNTTITAWEYSVNGGAFSTSLPTGVTRSGNIVTLTGATITAKTIAVRAKDVDGISDTLSIALVVDGANGASGADGENAIVGYLTNESSTLSANSAGTVANFTPASGTFKVYDGITDVTTNVNCVFSLNTSSNLTASITSSGAYSVSAMSEDTGTAEFKAVYNGVTILKTLTVAKSKTGATGATGAQGPSGVSSYTHIAYATNATGTTGFSTSVSTGATYIGMYVDSNPTDSETPSAYAWTLIKGADGSQGIQGPAGSNGQTPYLHIAYATNATGSTGFSTTDSVAKTYIGTYTDFTSADSSTPSAYSWTLIKGDTGATGATGQNAVLGFLTNEAITLPSNSAGTVSSFTGATGTFEVYDGITRKTGAGITYSVFASSNITASINATTGVYSVTAMTTGIGVLSGTATLRAVYGSVTIDKILNVSKSLQGVQGSTGSTGATGPQGSTGATGASATSYWLTPSVNTVIKKMDGTLNPTSVLFSGYSKIGTANPVAYSGRFIISTSTDGTNYTTRYTSASDQSGYTYTGIPTDSKFIKARFYQAGGTTILLDEQTIPVIETLDSIEIGGRNTFKKTTAIAAIAGTNTTTKNSLNGMSIVSTVAGIARMSNVINENGFWTFSAWVTSTAPSTLAIDFCDMPTQNFAVSTTRTKITMTSNVTNYTSATYHFIDIGGLIAATYTFEDVKVEKGNKATSWTPAPEDVAYDIEQKADSSATSDAINDVATSAANAQSTANSKLDKSSYDNFINEYIDYKKALASEQSASSKSLQDAKDAISLITNNMGDMKESWKFNNGTQIDATGNGMLLSDGTGGMNLLLSNNRISFFDSGVEVAYITDKTLKINHGIFVNSAQIGAHLISSSPSNPDITIVSWVGI